MRSFIKQGSATYDQLVKFLSIKCFNAVHYQLLAYQVNIVETSLSAQQFVYWFYVFVLKNFSKYSMCLIFSFES